MHLYFEDHINDNVNKSVFVPQERYFSQSQTLQHKS